MKKFLTLLFFIPLLGSTQEKFNEPEIYFEHIFLPGALHFNPINDIAQDSTGLMWFASNNGIYRYDGLEFKSSNQYSLFTSIHEEMIGSIVAGPENYIYASLRRSGAIIKLKNDFSEFTIFENESGSSNGVRQLFNFNGSIGFLTTGGSLYLLNEENGDFSELPSDFSFYSFCHIGSNIAAGSRERIILFKNLKEHQVLNVPQVPNVITGIQIKDKDIYFNTESQIFRLNQENQKLDLLFTSKDFKNVEITKTYLASNGDLWVLTSGNGLFVVKSTGQIQHFEKNYLKRGALSNNRIFDIYEDNSGIIWIGTGAGINKYDRQKRYFGLVSSNPGNPNSLSSEIVRGLYESEDEQILIGTDDGVVNILDSARKNIRKVALKNNDNYKVIPFSFVQKDADEVYMGTNLGLFTLNLKTGKNEKILASTGLSAPIFRQIVRYDEDEIIGLNYSALILYNEKTGIHTRLKANNDIYRLFSGDAKVIYVDDEKNVFIGGKSSVSILKLETGELINRSLTDDNHGIAMVLSIQKIEGILYIGTYQNGLYTLDLSDPHLSGELKRYGKKDGLPDNTIYATLEDEQGYIWISTNNGLSRLNPKNNTFYNYDRNNGLQGQEFNRLAAIETKRKEMVFGGIEGVNLFFPEKAEINREVAINPILIGVEVINRFDGDGEQMTPYYPLLNVDKLVLDYDENYLNFEFTSDNFSQPEKSSFLYKLENYDEGWIFTRDRQATYTNLNPGNYIFKVRSLDQSGNISEYEASIPIRVKVLWWRTWWMAAILITLIVGLIVYSFRRSLRRNMVIKKVLEKEIERRTSELKESKEELARLNDKKDFIFSILSHDLRSPLTTLKGFLNILIDHYHSMDEEEVKLHAVNIKNSVAKSLDLLDNTLYWSLSQMGEIGYSPTKVSLNNLFDKLLGLYDLTAKKKDIKLHFNLEPQEMYILADENMTYIILRNLLSNALKFTPTGKNVYISGRKDENSAIITIKDEGIGIKNLDISKIFDGNQNILAKGTSNEKGTGLGLQLCKKFLEMNKGKIEVHSIEHEGSIFVVTLPLYKSDEELLLEKIFTESDSSPER